MPDAPGPAAGARRDPVWSVLLGFAALLGVVVVVASVSPRFRGEVDRSVSRHPTPFTELYFTRPSSLPKPLATGGPSTFEFTIVNRETSATTYRYVVSGAARAATQPIASGQVTLPSGTAANVPVSFIPTEAGADYLVTVRLADRPEVVHFATRS